MFPRTFMELKNFERTFNIIARTEDANKIFDDFLTMCICCFSIDPTTGKSHYEEDYMQAVSRYDKNLVREQFPKLLSEMIIQMENHVGDSLGNDLLGEFFQRNISHGQNGQYFTPDTVTSFMAKITGIQNETRERLNILDPACGSGRMLTAFAKENSPHHNFYGVDTSPMCVKMTAINMLLNGLSGEVICANALDPNDFRLGYRIHSFPPAIRKILNKMQSRLFLLNQSTFTRQNADDKSDNEAGQLTLF